MPETTVEVHVAGVTGNDLDRIRERLERLNGVRIHSAEETRISVTYDQDFVVASDIQDAIEDSGGEVITMEPRR